MMYLGAILKAALCAVFPLVITLVNVKFLSAYRHSETISAQSDTESSSHHGPSTLFGSASHLARDYLSFEQYVDLIRDSNDFEPQRLEMSQAQNTGQTGLTIIESSQLALSSQRFPISTLSALSAGCILILIVFLSRRKRRKLGVESAGSTSGYETQLVETLLNSDAFHAHIDTVITRALSKQVEELNVANRKRFTSELSSYRLLNGQLLDLIHNIDNQLSYLGERLTSGYNLKVSQLVKEFQDLKISNAEYVTRIHQLQNLIDKLQNDASWSPEEDPANTSDTISEPISEPRVKAIDELRRFLK